MLIRTISDRFSQALIALNDNRLRTALSILGVMIGIASVIIVATVGRGGTHLVYSELETFGLKSVWVYRNYQDKDPHKRLREGTAIDNSDYKALRGCCSAVAKLSPVAYFNNEQTIQKTNKYSNANIKGVGISYIKINNDDLSRGREFRLSEVRNKRAVAILGPTTSTDLFGNSNPIGKEFLIGMRKYVVIGTLKAKSRDFLASIGSVGGQDTNNRILIPYTAVQQINGDTQIHVLRAESVSLEVAEFASIQLRDLLHHRHNKEYAYTIETMEGFVVTADRILTGVSIIGIIAASISLLVGGLGIANIISTSVLERTREIGMRKALGAQQSDLLWQFLLEAVIISTIGGIAGLILGGIISTLAAWLTGFPLIPSLPSIAIAFTVSILSGVLSGYIPARRAAKLHPVAALRYE